MRSMFSCRRRRAVSEVTGVGFGFWGRIDGVWVLGVWRFFFGFIVFYFGWVVIEVEFGGWSVNRVYWVAGIRFFKIG